MKNTIESLSTQIHTFGLLSTLKHFRKLLFANALKGREIQKHFGKLYYFLYASNEFFFFCILMQRHLNIICWGETAF